jgi:hypothetical protein
MKANATLLLVIFCFICHHGFGQSTDSLKLDSMIHKNLFRLDQGQFSGNGWEQLKKEVEKAQIVLIGEDHGFAEPPVFTEQLAAIFKPKALVVEVDPYLAAQLKKMSPYPEQYKAYLRKRPYGLSFYSWQQEMDLMTAVTRSGVDIWGLNEINFLSLGNFFNELAAQAKSLANKKLASRKDAEYTQHDEPIFKEMDTKMGDFSAYHMKVETIDSLIYSFKNENDFSRKMLNDMKQSVPIFYNTDGQLRVDFMKKNLLNYLSPYITKDAINIPKLMFKFGAYHVGRNDGITGYDEVGSLASNLAEAAGKQSLHILVIGKKGMGNKMAPIDNSKAIQPYNITDEDAVRGLAAFANQLKNDEWALFDLRKIQYAISSGKIVIKDRKLKGFIMGYDLLVIYAEASGSRFIE